MKLLAAICVKKKCAAILSHWKFFPFCVWIFYLPSMQLTEGTRPLQTGPGNILPIAEAMQSIPHKLTSDVTKRGRIKAGKKPVLSPCLSFSPFLKKSGGGRKSKSLSSLRSLAKWYQGIIVQRHFHAVLPLIQKRISWSSQADSLLDQLSQFSIFHLRCQSNLELVDKTLSYCWEVLLLPPFLTINKPSQGPRCLYTRFLGGSQQCFNFFYFASPQCKHSRAKVQGQVFEDIPSLTSSGECLQ